MGQSLDRSADNPDLPRVEGLSPSRMEQLKRDMALTPEDRVRAAEETLRLDRLRRPPGPHRVLTFDTYEVYLDYKFNVSAVAADPEVK